MAVLPTIRLAAALALALLCGTCALTTEQIDVPYQPAAEAQPVPGVATAPVAVSATDGRTAHRDWVSSEKNGYGMEMAAITAKEDVATAAGDAVRQELAARGFPIGAGGAKVKLEVARFYNDFKVGFWTGESDATVALTVKVSRGAVAFSKLYDANGVEPNSRS